GSLRDGLLRRRPLPRPHLEDSVPNRGVAYTFVVLLVLAATSRVALAGPGALDGGFGSGGFVTADLYRAYPTANSAPAPLLQPDGRLVAVGDSVFDGIRALRYTSDGRLDPSFGIGGIATADIRIGGTEFADAAVLQPDGKIVAAGYGYYP